MHFDNFLEFQIEISFSNDLKWFRMIILKWLFWKMTFFDSDSSRKLTSNDLQVCLINVLIVTLTWTNGIFEVIWNLVNTFEFDLKWPHQYDKLIKILLTCKRYKSTSSSGVRSFEVKLRSRSYLIIHAWS